MQLLGPGIAARHTVWGIRHAKKRSCHATHGAKRRFCKTRKSMCATPDADLSAFGWVASSLDSSGGCGRFFPRLSSSTIARSLAIVLSSEITPVDAPPLALFLAPACLRHRGNSRPARACVFSSSRAGARRRRRPHRSVALTPASSTCYDYCCCASAGHLRYRALA